MTEIIQSGDWLPYLFVLLMGLAMLIYTVLDGYDLGVGILIRTATDEQKDRMIASIGPFWDANETWLVLGVGILLVAFPGAHGVILSGLYLPVSLMLMALIFRGVAFDFRVKVRAEHKERWNTAFFAGSLMATLCQGYMLGSYILGFEHSVTAVVFSLLVGFALAASYSLIGASWLIMKTEDVLQRHAVRWARYSVYGTIVGIALISIATPMVSERIFHKWFDFPNLILLAPIPIMTGLLLLALVFILRELPRPDDRYCWAPFALTVAVFVLCFYGLAYSFFPYIVPERLTILEVASAPESLKIILVGVLIVFPFLIGYTILAYRVFHGKARDLSYD